MASCYTKEDLEILLDNIPYSAWIKDDNNTYVYVNKEYADIIGKVQEDIIGKQDIDIWPSNQCKEYRDSDAEVIRTRMPKMFEEVKEEGKYARWFETYKAAIFDGGEQPKYVLGTSREITLSKSLNQQLNESDNEFTTISQDKEYASGANIKEIMQLIERDIFRWLEASEVSIWIYNEPENDLELYAKTGMIRDRLVNRDYLALNKDQIIEGILPVALRKEYIDMNAIEKNNIQYMGLYKIEHEGEVVGVLTCLFKNERRLKLSQDDIIKKICNKICRLVKIKRTSLEVQNKIKEYRDNQTELNLFLEAVVDLVAIMDEEGHFKKISAAWSEVLGWREIELLEMTWEQLIHPEDLIYTVEMIYNYDKSNVLRAHRSRYWCKNGTFKWLEWNCKWVKENGTIFVAARDITEQVQMEQKSYELQKVVQLEMVKNEFFANISHEFRTPINTILGAIRLIESKITASNEKYEEVFGLIKHGKVMKQNTYRLLRLVNNLIDMTHIDTGHYEIKKHNVNIVNIIEEITLSVVECINDKGIELLFDTQIEEEIIACDPGKIERIILNLLSNAIKYTDKEGKIKVYIENIENDVAVSVEDNGSGISEEKQEIIFNRFIRGDDVLTRHAEGSGIGLSLVKSLVELHGGSIQIQSHIGKGTKVTFTLPKIQIEGEQILEKYDDVGKIETCKLEFSDVYW